MIYKKLRSTLFLSIVAVLFFATSLDAQMRRAPGEREFRGDRPVRAEIHKQLNLTEDQEAKLAELRTNRQKEMIDRQAALRKARLDLRQEMLKDQPDMSAIEQMIKDQESLRTEMHLSRVKHWNEIRDILTPEQREIWNQHKRDFGPRGIHRESIRGPRDRYYRR